MSRIGKAALVAGVAAVLLAGVGCNAASPGAQEVHVTGAGQPILTRSPAQFSPVEAFLQQQGLQVEGAPLRAEVQVPSDWRVPLGAYPTGLFWGMANELSRDGGLDLTPLKGQTAEVWRYALTGGLPGEGEQSQFRYPTDVVLLVREQQVVGAWLAFNKWGVGPSIKKRTLQEITGLTFDQWVERERYFADAGQNSDLANMGPAEVVAAFVDAINHGDQTRAQACLSANLLFDAMTMNFVSENGLYNPGFGENNSFAVNLTHGKLLSFKMFAADPDRTEIRSVGDRTNVEIMAELELTWRKPLDPTAPPHTTRFIGLHKQFNGWKMTGLATGP